jgi:hypothetical protein
MVSGVECAEKDIVAAHIWPAAADKMCLHDLGLSPVDVHSFRNGFLAVKKIEEAFDHLRLGTIPCAPRAVSLRLNNFRVLMLAAAKTSVTSLPLSGFYYDHVHDELLCHIFDPSLKGPTKYIAGLPILYENLHGRALAHPDGTPPPYRRLLCWHYAACVEHAVREQWPVNDVVELPLVDKVEEWLGKDSPDAKWPVAGGTSVINQDLLATVGRMAVETAAHASVEDEEERSSGAEMV